jgi:poly-gamma-glutamate synthase PgsB/CapB
MDATLLLAGATGLITSFGLLEGLSHRFHLKRIPIRIHVNGTRGKSGVTRLIAAGLRAGGIRTCAKATGTLPRMIFPDGSEYTVFRPSRANVIEQLRVIRAAVAHQAEAIVIECMAVQPMLQSLCELQLVRATHGVITNARPDHLDAMGPTATDVAKALAGTVPRNGKLFTAEQKYLNVLAAAARDRNAKLIPVSSAEVAAVTRDEMNGFSYIEHADNLALALKVCADVGVDRATALRGMWAATPDAGVMSAHPLNLLGRRIVFVNGFAANDPESTGQNWHLAINNYPDLERRIAVFNCRADRPDRSVQLAETCVRWQPADHYMVIGSATHIFAKRATAMGLDRSRLTCAENLPASRIVETVNGLADRSALVMGMGNIGGPGMDMVRYFQNQSLLN